MNAKNYYWILYLITTTIILTIFVQLYWNYNNYLENKQQVRNEIQLSLDNAVEEYYSSLAKNNFITIIKDSDEQTVKRSNRKPFDTIISKIKNNSNSKKNTKSKFKINNIQISSDENFSQEKIDSMMLKITTKIISNSISKSMINSATISPKVTIDTIKSLTQFNNHKSKIYFGKNRNSSSVKYYRGKEAADSLKLVANLKPIFISFLDQTIDYNKIDSLIENQLSKKGIDLKTSFHHIKNDTLFKQTNDTTLHDKKFSVTSKSTYIKDFEAFDLYYSNSNFEALKRSFGGISLSFILSLLIISCLFYLLKIINQQKQLSEIKNDLINNITHEFKTPIATISTAIEAIENFNVMDDKEKTKQYASISSFQLKKLHQMVEKLLETASLDSESLILQREPIDLVDLILKIVKKHELLTKKNINFTTNTDAIILEIDPFHFENAISNVIDNAVKYGGNRLEVNLTSMLNTVEISVTDNGDGIEKNQQERIFDKFYRVPKGNTHDVKGFGIGLYYTHKIIEKHGGEITVLSNFEKTTFKLLIPNE